MVIHEGVALTPGAPQVREALLQQIVSKGWDTARGWMTRFVNMDIQAELQFTEFGQPRVPRDTLRTMRDVLNAEFGRVATEREEFLRNFEQRSVGIATEVLNTSETQIKEQLKTLGIKKDTFLGFETDGYTMDRSKAEALKAATQDLISKRKEADKAANVYFKARDEAKAIFNKTSAPPLAEALPEVFLSPELQQRVETTKAEGLRLATEYDALCAEKQKTFPVLATVSSGRDALSQLMDLAGRKPDDMATKIALIAQDRLSDIATVRGELGARFSVWKEPHLRTLTKQAMKVEPWQSRVAEEKATSVQAAEENTKKLMAAVAIGLGLIAALPTGGGSLVVAGVVTAAAVGSMVISVYGAYEHYQDYTLATAALGTSFDKAKAISQGDPPDVFWLALDIVTAITDIQAAASAFKTIKTLLIEAKAANDAAKLSELTQASRRAGLAAETEAKLVAQALGDPGDPKKIVTSLEQIKKVFVQARKVATDADLAEAFLKAAEKQINAEKVVLFTGSADDKAAILAMVKRNAKPGMNVEAQAAELTAKIEKRGTNGLYDPFTDTIIVKGDRSPAAVAATLAHELAHQRQNIKIGLENMGTMHMEFQAFYAQQQFLRSLNLPPQRYVKGYEWLMTADKEAIRAHVVAEYEIKFGPVTWKNFDESSDFIINALKGKK
jgi:hypothetical protein